MINFKAIVIAVLWSLTARVSGKIAENYLGWDSTSTATMILSAVILWIYMDLEQARDALAEMRSKVRVVLDKMQEDLR